jgi:hypothetical protein
MKKIKHFLPICLILFLACAGSRSGSTEERGSRDMPSWALNTPVSDDIIYAVGQGKKQNPSLSMKTAVGRARSEISQVVTTKVKTLFIDFMQESGVGENAQALEFTENVTKQVSNNVLNGSKVTETYPAKDGTIFALVEYSLDLAKQEAIKAIRTEEAMFNEFKARQGLEALEEAIKNME